MCGGGVDGYLRGPWTLNVHGPDVRFGAMDMTCPTPSPRIPRAGIPEPGAWPPSHGEAAPRPRPGASERAPATTVRVARAKPLSAREWQ